MPRNQYKAGDGLPFADLPSNFRNSFRPEIPDIDHLVSVYCVPVNSYKGTMALLRIWEHSERLQTHAKLSFGRQFCTRLAALDPVTIELVLVQRVEQLKTSDHELQVQSIEGKRKSILFCSLCNKQSVTHNTKCAGLAVNVGRERLCRLASIWVNDGGVMLKLDL
eukprot:6193282-Pleurochrysis_carterae.AAC.2